MSKEAEVMKIKAIAPWFGAKRNLAPRIVELLGAHRAYWEPFCGSMAVLMAKPPCVMETVNDLHGDLINLAFVVRDERLAPKLYRKLRRTLMHEQIFIEAAERCRQRGHCFDAGEPDLNRAYDYFVCSWMGRNGVAGTSGYNQGYCLRFTSRGGHAATRWKSVVESIPAWRRRLRQVTILQRDAFEIIPRIEDEPKTVLYIDPPYIEHEKDYVNKIEPDDYARLAEMLYRFRKARVVVSYYDHPKLNELYPNWQRHEIVISKSLAHQGRRGQNDMRVKEVLLVNQRTGHMALFD